MKISAKGRYALAAAIEIARQSEVSDNYVTSIGVSKALGISKIFLEQVMANLKKSGLVVSAKGAGGGYKIACPVERVTAWDILIAAEFALFEKTDNTVLNDSPHIEAAIREHVFDKLDSVVKTALEQISLRELLDSSNSRNEEQAFMLNI